MPNAALKNQQAMTVINPGYYTSLTNAEYHTAPGFNKSLMPMLDDSPSTLKRFLSLPRQKPTSAMKKGTVFHTLVLEPEKESEIVVVPKLDMRKKADKERAKQIQAEIMEQGKIDIDQVSYDMVRSMRDSVFENETAMDLLREGISESSYFWQDQTGVLCKCRPDHIHPSGIVVDLKSCEDASPYGFSKAVWDYRYDLQVAHYLNGTSAIDGKRYSQFFFICVEKKGQQKVKIYEADEDMKRLAYKEVRRLIDLYAECKRNDSWPCNVESIGLPEWAKTEIEPEPQLTFNGEML